MRNTTGALERRKFYQLHQEGKTYEEIAEQFGVSAMCVRMWCRRQRDGKGVANRYYNPRSGALSQFGEGVRQQIEKLKREHPGWGPESIRLHLSQKEGEVQPSRASIGRYLHIFEEFRRKAKKGGIDNVRLQSKPCTNAGRSTSK